MLKMGGVGMSERGPILLNSDPHYVEFGPNLGIQPIKGPNFRPMRAAIHHEDRVYDLLPNGCHATPDSPSPWELLRLGGCRLCLGEARGFIGWQSG